MPFPDACPLGCGYRARDNDGYLWHDCPAETPADDDDAPEWDDVAGDDWPEPEPFCPGCHGRHGPPACPLERDDYIY